jgi:hypothetical protein
MGTIKIERFFPSKAQFDLVVQYFRSSFTQNSQPVVKNNLAYLINYEQRESSARVYTSQVAESHIDSLINARHKRQRKMQWTREVAHNVLQIRAKMVSQEWSKQWQDTVLDTLINAA